MALISAALILAIGIAHARYGRGDGSRISTLQTRLAADLDLAATARDIDRASVGDTHVARFLGVEFGMSEEAILAERRATAARWGNLTIAHTLAASDSQGMTVAQVLHLHDLGMGWGQIAAGLRFRLDDAVRAVEAESRVARGLKKADGKIARIGADGL